MSIWGACTQRREPIARWGGDQNGVIVLCTRQPRTERSARVFILSNLKIVQCVEGLIKVFRNRQLFKPISLFK